MVDDLEILACPTTGQRLRLSDDGVNLTTANGDAAYRLADGVARLLPDARATNEVQSFYEEKGWAQTDEGVFGETKAYVDTRAAPFAFTKRCMRRLQRHFRRGGRYLLDAGSGPIPHNELLDYGRAGAISAAAFANYTDGFRDNLSAPQHDVDDWTTLDLHLSIDLGAQGPIGRSQVSFSVINLFDEDPPFVNNASGVGYDPSNADPLGRFVAIELSTRF